MKAIVDEKNKEEAVFEPVLEPLIKQTIDSSVDEELGQAEESRIDSKRVNKAIAYGCRALGLREHSQLSMVQKLKIKGFDKNEIEQAIDFLLDNNWLSDQRFCEVYIRSKANSGQGLSRIKYDLSQKGISQLMIEASLSEQDINWQHICDEVTDRKTDCTLEKNDLKARQKIERFLRYRGFSGDQIRKSIDQCINKKHNNESRRSTW